MASSPVTVTVTGAAGQIGYALLFRIASGQLLGADTPVRLRLLEIPQAVKAAEGTAMELDDCAFPLLDGVDIYDDATAGVRRRQRRAARRRAAARPRAWSAATCSRPTAASSSRRARRSTPARPTTSACSSSATRRTPTRSSRRRTRRTCRRERFTAMTRLDHNRARLPARRRRPARRSRDIARLTIWGNHSATQYPDLVARDGRRPPGARGRRRRRLGARHVHPDGGQARRGDHRGARRVVGGVGGERGDRPRAHLGARHARGRLDLGGHRLRRLVRRARGPHLVVPRDVRRRRAGRSCRTCRSTSSPAAGSTRRSPSWSRSATRCRRSACSDRVGRGGHRPAPGHGRRGVPRLGAAGRRDRGRLRPRRARAGCSSRWRCCSSAACSSSGRVRGPRSSGSSRASRRCRSRSRGTEPARSRCSTAAAG